MAVSSVFAGENSISAEKIAWARSYDDDYKIISTGNEIDLSYHTEGGGTTTWEMIAGDADQLNLSNVRYRVQVKTDRTSGWLKPVIRKQNSDGSYTDNLVKSAEYRDYSYQIRDRWDWRRNEYIYLHSESLTGNDALYLKLNKETFGSNNVKVYEGELDSPEAAGQAKEITSEILGEQGYKLPGRYEYITLISYDGNGKVTGFLPVQMGVNASNESFNFWVEDADGKDCYYSSSSRTENNCVFRTYELYKGNPASQQYYVSAYHRSEERRVGKECRL